GELYFNFKKQRKRVKEETEFKLSLEQFQKLQKQIEKAELDVEILELFEFIKQAIEGREYAKFVFTHVLSDVLELIVELGAKYQLDREELSHLNIRVIMEAYTSSYDLKESMLSSILIGKKQAKQTESLV